MQTAIAEHLPALFKASWQGGVLILLVLAVQRLFARRLDPRWRCGLWLLVMLRLALPWTSPSPISLFNLFNFSAASGSSTPAETVSGVMDPEGGASSVAPAKSTGSLPLPSPAIATMFGISAVRVFQIWFLGAAVLALYLIVFHHRFAKQITGCRPLVDEAVMNLLEDCKEEMGVRVPVAIIETRQVASPALFGCLRPRLLLPEGLTRNFSLDEMRYIFLHELGHIKRRDILASWLMMGLQIPHWFNPLVWLAFHRMRVDRELACDALALSYARDNENQSYGRTMIKLLESFGRAGWAPSLAGTVETKNQLKERIAMIATFKKSKRGLSLAIALFTGLGLVTLTDAETGPTQAARDLIGTWVCVGTPGAVGEAPVVGGRIKLLTDTQWSLTQADPTTGATLFHHGGTWKLQDDEYSETVEFANSTTSNLVHHTFKFKIKLEGDMLTLIGVGNPWKEVWQRVKPGGKPLKSDSLPQGKWSGIEVGSGGGKATLVLKDSTFEFHGANRGEWYKATFTSYDTSPKQLVILITDCSVSQYVGKTAFAIYQMQDNTLTITGNEPGNPTVPAGFDADGARKFVFKPE